MGERERDKKTEIYFKDMAPAVMGAGESKFGKVRPAGCRPREELLQLKS